MKTVTPKTLPDGEKAVKIGDDLALRHSLSGCIVITQRDALDSSKTHTVIFDPGDLEALRFVLDREMLS